MNMHTIFEYSVYFTAMAIMMAGGALLATTAWWIGGIVSVLGGALWHLPRVLRARRYAD